MDELGKGFNFFVPLELQKSEEHPDAWIVGGVISTREKDFDGETVVQKGLDFHTYFRDNGFIKYEHKADTPDNIVGVPNEPEVGENETRIRGTLLKSIPMAKQVYDLAKALEGHNQRHPENPRRLGWSIEGKYINRLPNGSVEKALVTNVVITPNPKNTSTYLELCKSLGKTMVAGYGTSPETQTGGGAIRKESLEGTPKEEVSGTGKDTDFESFEDAYAHYRGKGLSRREAKKKAKEHFKEEASKAMGANIEELEGRVNEMGEKLNEAVDMFKSLAASASERGGGSGSPSAEDSGEGFIDATEFVRDISEKVDGFGKSLQSMQEGSDNALKEIAKGMAAIGDHISNVAETQESLSEELAAVKKSQEETDKLVKAIARQDLGVVFSDLEEERIGEDAGDSPKLSKGQVTGILTDMAIEGKLDQSWVTSFELNGMLPEDIQKSVNARAKEVGLIG